MMTTRKILMILAGLVLGAALTTYLMVLQADRRATAEATAGMDESANPPAADSRVSENHMTEGSIGSSTLPPGAGTKSAAVRQQPIVPAPAPAAPAPMTAAPAPAAPAPAPTAAAPAAPAPAPSTSMAITQQNLQQQAQPQPKPAPSAAVASVNVPDAATPKVAPAPRSQRGRDSLDRRAAAYQGATPETDELVRQSSKLDPLLPPPAAAAPPTLNSANMDQHNTYRGSYHSGAAQTDQLVRDSAKLDPSLPPPDMSAVRAAAEQQARSTKPTTNTNTNPVAAALTDQLVRDSAKLDPSLPPPK
ncbi:hypothetical protein [Paraburkholderia azotifigens]|uniref:Extensin n=1 Tax=Paraburkholderia azotifigens TaxID=2057004 RepID=A0A5C6V8A0_9BURK|nr:hypothetical protein [Paraburkholderia azotifigens]TXC80078.1 hypothetical protein FRZ40_37855 [Paraburkholderia azotifigens]